jgi:hypothetical protein
MNRSSSRVLTTHVGSLVRPGPIAEVLRAESLGQATDQGAFERILTPAVAEVVRKQVEVGIDVPSVGEFGKTMWTQDDVALTIPHDTQLPGRGMSSCGQVGEVRQRIRSGTEWSQRWLHRWSP